MNGRFDGTLHGGDQKVLGGEFWWSLYGVIAGPARPNHYAEIVWRGKKDYHGTMACRLAKGQSWDSVNRWACSIQVTKVVKNRIAKWLSTDGSFPQHLVDDS